MERKNVITLKGGPLTLLGDEVKMGVLSSVMPGKMIGDHCWIGANVMVEENVERYSHVMAEQKLKVSKLK